MKSIARSTVFASAVKLDESSRNALYCNYGCLIKQLNLFDPSVFTRGVQEIRGQMLPFPQYLTERRETYT